MSVQSELVSTTRSHTETVADQFWIIAAFCAVGFAATMHLFEQLPLLSSQMPLG